LGAQMRIQKTIFALVDRSQWQTTKARQGGEEKGTSGGETKRKGHLTELLTFSPSRQYRSSKESFRKEREVRRKD